MHNPEQLKRGTCRQRLVGSNGWIEWQVLRMIVQSTYEYESRISYHISHRSLDRLLSPSSFVGYRIQSRSQSTHISGLTLPPTVSAKTYKMQPPRFLTPSALTPFLRPLQPFSSKTQPITRISSIPLSFSHFLTLISLSHPIHTTTTPVNPKMSYSSDEDQPDPELLELLRQHLNGNQPSHTAAETGVLESAEFVYNHAIDVALDMRGCKKAANTIWDQMQQREYSPATWSTHELHPKDKNEETVKFIFTMDLLNFSFWSEKSEEERFQVEYRDKRWTGYWSLVAGLQRGLEEGLWSSLILASDLALFTDIMMSELYHSYVTKNTKEPFIDTGGMLFLVQESPSPIPHSGSITKHSPQTSSAPSSGPPQTRKFPYSKNDSTVSAKPAKSSTKNTMGLSWTSSKKQTVPPRPSSTSLLPIFPASLTSTPTPAGANPSVSSSAHKSSSLTCGLALKAKAMDPSRILTKSPCLPTTASRKCCGSSVASCTVPRWRRRCARRR